MQKPALRFLGVVALSLFSISSVRAENLRHRADQNSASSQVHRQLGVLLHALQRRDFAVASGVTSHIEGDGKFVPATMRRFLADVETLAGQPLVTILDPVTVWKDGGATVECTLVWRFKSGDRHARITTREVFHFVSDESRYSLVSMRSTPIVLRLYRNPEELSSALDAVNR